MTGALDVPAAYQYLNSAKLLLTPPKTNLGLAGEPKHRSGWDWDTRHF